MDSPGFRDAALIAVASDALLRVSEVAALEVGDIDWSSSALLVRRSKTDQEAEGAVLYLGEPTLNRVREWLEASEISEGPLFRPVTKSGQVRSFALSTRSVRQVIKDRAEACRRRRSGLGSLAPGRDGSIIGSSRGNRDRDAAGGPLAVALDAGALCPGRVGR